MVRIDQGGAGLEIGGVQQTSHGHVHKIRVAKIAISVGVHKPTGLGKQIPALHLVGAVLGDVGVFQKAKALQNSWTA